MDGVRTLDRGEFIAADLGQGSVGSFEAGQREALWFRDLPVRVRGEQIAVLIEGDFRERACCEPVLRLHRERRLRARGERRAVGREVEGDRRPRRPGRRVGKGETGCSRVGNAVLKTDIARSNVTLVVADRHCPTPGGRAGVVLERELEKLLAAQGVYDLYAVDHVLVRRARQVSGV